MKYLKQVLSDQAGIALPMALILMMLGGLLIVPVLDFIATNLNAGLIVEQRTMGTFAAEAGINDAIWRYKYSGQDPFSGGSSYVLAETLNGMTVTVYKQKEETVAEGTRYTIKSTATLNGVTEGVSISQVLYSVNPGFSSITNGALVSPGNITINNNAVIDGDVYVNGTLSNSGTIVPPHQVITTPIAWPDTDATKAFYWDQVEDLTPLSSLTITNNQGTLLNPVLLGPVLVNGDVIISNNCFVKLTGTVYVKGNFTADNNVNIIMNSQAVFCEHDINFTNNGVVASGSGAFIAIGNLNINNNISAGGQTKLIGVSSSVSPSSSASANRFLLSKFTATATGTLSVFKIRCTGSANVKVAIYADSGGSPGTKLNAVDTSTPVVSGWNSIVFPATNITSGTNYWLAANASSNKIGQKNVTSVNKYKSATYSSFSFPNPAGSGFTSTTTDQYLLAGYSLDYVMFMSLEGNANVANNSVIVGTVAGKLSVTVNNNAQVSSETPPSDLNIPTDEGDATVEQLNYTTQ